MLRDVPFVLNLVLWVIVVVAIVYRLRPSSPEASTPGDRPQKVALDVGDAQAG